MLEAELDEVRAHLRAKAEGFREQERLLADLRAALADLRADKADLADRLSHVRTPVAPPFLL